jgi:hypothetical protein
VRVHEKRVLVAALVAVEPQMRQNYFLFWVRDADFRADDLPREGDALRAAGFARRVLAAREALDAGRAALGAETRRTSGAGARCTIVNRVWSPIV